MLRDRTRATLAAAAALTLPTLVVLGVAAWQSGAAQREYSSAPRPRPIVAHGQTLLNLDPFGHNEYSCTDLTPEASVGPVATRSPSLPAPQPLPTATPPPTLESTLRAACEGITVAPKPRATLTEATVISDQGGQLQATLTVALVVPTDSVVYRLIANGEAARRPQRYAELLLGARFSDLAPYAFGVPQVSQTEFPAISPPTPTPRSPSPLSTLGPTPVPTMLPGPLTTITLVGTGQVYGISGRVSVAFNDVLRLLFTLSGRLEVDAGPGVITGTDGDVVRQARGQNQTVAGTFDVNARPSVQLRLPGTVSTIPYSAHRSFSPNIAGVDSLAFGVLSALGFLSVCWALSRLQRRVNVLNVPGGGVAAGPPSFAAHRVGQLVMVLRGTAGWAVALSVATGLCWSMEFWEYRWQRHLFGANESSLQVPGAFVAATVLVALFVALVARRGTHRVASALGESSAKPRLSPVLPWIAGMAAVAAAALATLVAVGIVHTKYLDGFTSAADRRHLRAALICWVVATLLLSILAALVAAALPVRTSLPRKAGGLILIVVGTAAILALGLEDGIIGRGRGIEVVLVRAVVPAVGVMLAVAFLAEMIATTVAGRPPTWRRRPKVGGDVPAPRYTRRLGAMTLAGCLALGVAVAIPGADRGGYAGGSPLDWFASAQAAFTLRTLATIAVLAALIAILRRIVAPSTGLDPVSGLRLSRVLAGCFAILLWSPIASWWFVPIAFAASVALIRWLLLPRSRLREAEALCALTADTQNAMLAREIDAVALRKALDAKLTATFADADGTTVLATEAKVANLRRARALLSDTPQDVDGVQLSAESCRFSHVADSDPWRRGLVGALIATVTASPWIVLSIRSDVLHVLLGRYRWGLGQFILDVPFDVAWWTGLGFFFGWAYPVIRGQNGSLKALTTLTAIGVPLLIVDFFPGPPGRHQLVTSVQSIAETASVLLVLGLAAEYLLFKRAGFGLGKLIEARKLSAIATWVASLAAAVGVAITSIIVSGVTVAFMYLSHPNPPAPASAGTASNSGK